MLKKAGLVLSVLVIAGCGGVGDVQCEDDTNCGLSAGGLCTVAPSGNQWCTYEDSTCESGRRWSDLDVGDGLSGECVGEAGADAGQGADAREDAGVLDAGPGLFDANGACVDRKIAYFSLDGIYVANADGSGTQSIGPDTAEDFDWSPNGDQIAYKDTGADPYEIWVMNSDGSGATYLAEGTGRPAWSPDGTKIAFVSPRDGNFEIFSMNANGSSQTQLTFTTATNSSPRWSPDGSQILFVSLRDGNNEIYVMNANGTSQTNLTNYSGVDQLGIWSRDGLRIAFARTDGDEEIFVMNSDGSAVTNLTNTPNTYDDSAPDWTPDGRILFQSDRDGNSEIYVVDANGLGLTRLTDSAATERYPLASPSGELIAYSVGPEVGVMNADGSNATTISATGFSFGHRWQPCD